MTRQISRSSGERVGRGAGGILLGALVLCGCGQPEDSVSTSTSEQQILPGESVQPGGSGCPPWLYCPPVPTVLASDVKPTSIASDGTTVFFTNDFDLGGPKVLKLPAAGGATTTLLSGWSSYGSIRIAEGKALWVEWGSDSIGGLWWVRTSGGQPAKAFSYHNDTNQPQNLAVLPAPGVPLAGVQAFWGNDYAAKLYSVQLQDWFNNMVLVSTTALVAGNQCGFQPSKVNCYPHSVAADSTNVYFEDDLYGWIYRLPWAGGDPTLLDTGATIAPITTDGSSVFYVKGGFIRKLPVGGGAATNFAPAGGTISSITARNGTLYWTCSTCQTVMKQPIAGGGASTVAAGQSSPTAIAVDDTYVYWGTTTALKRLPK
jgi:hypothetical protein